MDCRQNDEGRIKSKAERGSPTFPTRVSYVDFRVARSNLLAQPPGRVSKTDLDEL